MWVMGEWAVGQWIVGVTSFQKIFGLCGLKCHIVEIWRDVTLDDGRTDGQQRTECEDRARILETEFAIWLVFKTSRFLPLLQIGWRPVDRVDDLRHRCHREEFHGTASEPYL